MKAHGHSMNAVSRLDGLATVHAEWTPWLRVVREVLPELSNPAWDGRPPRRSAAPDHAPLLFGAALRPDRRAVVQLLDRLASVARAQGLHALAGDANSRQATSEIDAMTVFLASVNDDHAPMDRLGLQRGASRDGWRTLVQLLPMPYLHACAREWAALDAGNWTQGYCPVCGAWPAFAEVRGIQRARHLRCGRCGAAWAMPALACTYCAETDHEALGTLVADEKMPRFSVDVCRSCSGYLKSCTTLQAWPSEEVVVTDLASVDFDIAAVERGYLRPPELGMALHASLDVDEDPAPTAPPWWS
jgi:FdhE protein